MIKFFRRVRYDLMNQNKTSKPFLPPASPSGRAGKYFKYAIGEIILVVIGILIALQINNWNENNNRSKKEVALLQNVKIDLETDVANLKRQDSVFAKKEIEAELGLDLFYKAKTIKDIDSVMRLGQGTWNELYINQNTYNEMINSGSMYAIKNKALQKKINSYYVLVEAHIEYIRGVNTQQARLWELDPAMYTAKLLLSQIKKPTLDLKLIDTTWINNPKSATFLSLDNYLHSNQELSNVYRREVFRRIITAADELRAFIAAEIDQY
jgi:hypothetical protein